MKMDLYQLFSAETKQSEREEAVENVRTLTLRKIEQSETKRHLMRRPLRTVLLAAAALALLVSSVFAAPLLWNAITGIEAEQNARPVLYFDENTVIVEGGYIDIVPEITPNPNAPEQIQTYYVPAQAASWTAEPFVYTSPSLPDLSKGYYGEWTLPDGTQVMLRQCVVSLYSPGAGFDEVAVGYDSRYTIEQRDYDHISAQCVVVPPSQALEGKEDPGRKKLYWSDGDYLFTLEVSYSMSDEALAEIMNSLHPVDEILPYLNLVYKEVKPSVKTAVQDPVFPSYMPENWKLFEKSGIQGDGSYIWFWDPTESIGYLEFDQIANEPDMYYEMFLTDWLSLWDVQPEEVTLGEWTIKTFEDDFRTALLWRTEDEVFYFKCCGEERLDVSELLKIAASLAPLETP